MSVTRYIDLYYHVGHAVEVVSYGQDNVAIECNECSEVLVDFDSNND
jgi:hypothetical protein